MKLNIASEPHQLFTYEIAKEKAKELNDNDDWTYKVVPCPKGIGYSFIEIYDEDGEFVSKL